MELTQERNSNSPTGGVDSGCQSSATAFRAGFGSRSCTAADISTPDMPSIAA